MLRFCVANLVHSPTMACDLRLEANHLASPYRARRFNQSFPRIAGEKTLPFVIGTPNKTTATAIDELEQGKGKAFNDVNKLMADLDADD